MAVGALVLLAEGVFESEQAGAVAGPLGQGHGELEALPLIVRDAYDPQTFFRQVAFRETSRCLYCYSLRLNAAASLAGKSGFDAFTTTLLYSRQQKHELVVALAEDASRKYGVPFYYKDFRVGWTEGQERAKALGMYRQQYCGCVYSEMDRFCGKPQKRSVRKSPAPERQGKDENLR